MTAHDNSSQTGMHLSHALLVYGSDDTNYAGSASIAATAHPVRVIARVPTIMPGVPVTPEAVRDLLIKLSDAGTKCKGEYLPENVICFSPTKLVWWNPACVREIFFSISQESKDKSKELHGKRVTHPPLLFVATPKALHVFSLRQNKRPRPETKLYQAPYYNVSEQGVMCFGNVPAPGILSPASIPKFESSFFDTHFTHTNVGGIVRHPEGHYGYWKSMTGPRIKKDVCKFLVDTKQTLADLLNK